MESALNADFLTQGYEIELELARGGMTTVYLARDVQHGRQVAVKLLARTPGPLQNCLEGPR